MNSKKKFVIALLVAFVFSLGGITASDAVSNSTCTRLKELGSEGTTYCIKAGDDCVVPCRIDG